MDIDKCWKNNNKIVIVQQKLKQHQQRFAKEKAVATQQRRSVLSRAKVKGSERLGL